MIAPLEQAFGLLLTAIVLLDIFLTVLYARLEVSLIGARIGRLVWACFVLVSKAMPRRRGLVLSFCGPTILITLVGVWALGLTLGAALVMHPELGAAIKASSGATPTDFISAMYAGGASMAIVGASDFTPHTSATRLLYLINSLIGTSVISLTLTYLMQVYTALQQRNALAMNIHLLSSCTGDAAELLARLGPRGQFSAGYTHLAELGAEMTDAKEAHHFYPVLFYFRFDDPHHSVSRSALVLLDAVSLIRSGLNDKELGWLMESGAVTQIWEASMMLILSLERYFVAKGSRGREVGVDVRMEETWRRRYGAALARLRRAGLETVDDEQAGAEAYVACRRQWRHHIANLAPTMAYSMEEIDPATNGLEARERRTDIHSRLNLAE